MGAVQAGSFCRMPARPSRGLPALAAHSPAASTRHTTPAGRLWPAKARRVDIRHSRSRRTLSSAEGCAAAAHTPSAATHATPAAAAAAWRGIPAPQPSPAMDPLPPCQRMAAHTYTDTHTHTAAVTEHILQNFSAAKGIKRQHDRRRRFACITRDTVAIAATRSLVC